MDTLIRSLYASLALALGLGGMSSCSKSADEVAQDLCPNPEPVEVDGHPTGFANCDGRTVREQPQQCVLPAPDDETCMASVDDPDFPSECVVDADCTDGPNGYCGLTFSGMGIDHCACNYACSSDADCDAGSICDCGALSGDASKSRCVPAGCDSRDSCDGYGCAVFDAMPYCGDTTISCQTPDDTCHVDADCGAGAFCIQEDGVFTCVPGECAIGRPFLVGGRQRLAPVVGDSETTPASHGQTGALAGERRARLAASWTQSARLEHASIAAFARFTAQLLAQGAPLELVAKSREAMADEARHTELCLDLAASYGGDRPVLGRLDVRGSIGGESIEDILTAVVAEGCVGETVAAAQAAALAREVDNPNVRGVYQTIAADELRHAALAWKYLTWAIGQERLRVDVARVLRRAARSLELCGGDSPTADDREWMRLGSLTPAAATAIHNDVVAHVIRPLLAQVTAKQIRLRARRCRSVRP